MKADRGTEAAIKALFDEYIDAYLNRDIERIMALFAPDPDVIAIGTGDNEHLIGKEAIRSGFERDFDQSEALNIEMPWIFISASGPVAWVSSDCVIDLKTRDSVMHINGRSTSVMVKRGNKWLIIQSHFSLPVTTMSEKELTMEPV